MKLLVVDDDDELCELLSRALGREQHEVSTAGSLATARAALAQQRPDGGFGEHEQSAFEDRYVSLPEGHCVQTAWALLAMAEGGSTCAREARERAARFLVSRQRADGSWPRERMVGVFFRTALVDYDLYRAYFPVWALAVHAAHPAAGTHAAPPAPR